MNVLVVSRTRMGQGRVCVGALEIPSGRSIRILGGDLDNLPEEHPIRPGDIWDVDFERLPGRRPPHVEDVRATTGRKLEAPGGTKDRILGLIRPWDGELDEIFDRSLQVTDAGTAFVGEGGPIPSMSTGFWIATDHVHLSEFAHNGIRYWFPNEQRIRSVKYVGLSDPVEVIPR